MSQLSLQDAMRLAVRHHQAGELAQAEAIYRSVLQRFPNQPDALHLLGVVAHQVGKHPAAIELIRSAIAGGLKSASVYNNLGEACRLHGDFPQAEACYREAIRLDPQPSGAHSNLGIVLHEQGRLDEAAGAFEEALRLQPDSVEALNNFANLQMQQGRLHEAERMFRRAIALRPDYAEAHNNLATVMEKYDRFEDAIVEYQLAMKLNPGFVEAAINLGSAYQKLNKLNEAQVWWNRALTLRPDHSDGHWNLALATLAGGDYRRGFAMYESRFACAHSRQYRREYPQPRWSGDDLGGRTILLYPEQGFGDVLQFARFVPLVAARGGRVILECHPELIQIMKTLAGADEVVASGDAIPAFDLFLPLLSVPAVLGISQETLPHDVPYLSAAADKTQAWASKLPSAGANRRVGIVWSGKQTPDPKRTCPIELFAALGDVKGIDWFSFQTGSPAAQLSQLPQSFRPVDIGSSFADFSDTAAAMANLDLLITIDTAAAHLAGAMGIRTWTLIPFAPDWRWMQDREDSPWYPTMKLFRQPAMNDWASVITRIRAQLIDFAGA